MQITAGRGNAASRILSLRISDAIELVCSMDPWAVVLPNGTLTTEAEVDRATVSAIKKFGLNLVVLPSESLHTLLDGVIMEIQAWEQCALNVINE